jgi:hypothetical protein
MVTFRIILIDRVHQRRTRTPSSRSPRVEEAIQHITGFYGLDEKFFSDGSRFSARDG